jgi:hypothetical protein
MAACVLFGVVFKSGVAAVMQGAAQGVLNLQQQSAYACNPHTCCDLSLQGVA